MVNGVDGSSMVGHRVDSVVGHGVDSVVGNGVDGVVGNHRGSMDSVVSHWVDGGLVYRLGVGLSLVSDISNKPILMVSVVGHNLHSAVRKLNSVLSLDNTVLILRLSLDEVSAVLISSSVLVREWLRGQFFLVIRSWWWVIGGGGGGGGGGAGGIGGRGWGIGRGNNGWGSHGG